MSETVWAFKALPELKGELGFVACDADLAARLIAEGLAQDPRMGATALREIDYTPPAKPAPTHDAGAADYDDKAVTPKRRGKS